MRLMRRLRRRCVMGGGALCRSPDVFWAACLLVGGLGRVVL